MTIMYACLFLTGAMVGLVFRVGRLGILCAAICAFSVFMAIFTGQGSLATLWIAIQALTAVQIGYFAGLFCLAYATPETAMEHAPDAVAQANQARLPATRAAPLS